MLHPFLHPLLFALGLPLCGFFKINIDAVFQKNALRGWTRIIIRDSAGAFIIGSCSTFHYFSPLQGEAIAFKEAILLAIELNFLQVQVEIDALGLVQALNKQPTTFS